MKKLLKLLGKHYVYTTAIGVFVVLTVVAIINPWGIRDSFWSNDSETAPSPFTIVSFIGLCCGGIILLFQANEANRRNRIMEKGQLDTRFKDAALLLASESTSAIISGIYALHQVAVEASKGSESQKGYVKTVNDILCAYLRESAGDDEQEVKAGKLTLPDQEPNSRTKRICKRPKVVVQTIVDVLFKSKGKIYDQYYSDLSDTVFNGINFYNASISKADFSGATISRTHFLRTTISETDFLRTTISGTDFSGATISRTDFREASISGTDFREASISGTDFSWASISGTYFLRATISRTDFLGATISRTDFSEASISGTYFGEASISRTHFSGATISGTYFSGAILKNVNFKHLSYSSYDYVSINKETKLEDVSFSNTKLEGYSYEEIIERAREITKE